MGADGGGWGEGGELAVGGEERGGLEFEDVGTAEADVRGAGGDHGAVRRVGRVIGEEGDSSEEEESWVDRGAAVVCSRRPW